MIFRGWGATPMMKALTYYLANFLPICMKMKEIGSRKGRGVTNPWGPP